MGHLTFEDDGVPLSNHMEIFDASMQSEVNKHQYTNVISIVRIILEYDLQPELQLQMQGMKISSFSL